MRTKRTQATCQNPLTLEKKLYLFGIAVPFILLVMVEVHQWLLAPLFPFQGCIWDTLFGIYCPGCGGTRAVLALLHGKIFLSLWYHPFVPYAVFMYACFMISHTVTGLLNFYISEKAKNGKKTLLRGKRLYGMRFHPWYLYAGVVVIAVNFVLKNVLRLKFHIYM